MTDAVPVKQDLIYLIEYTWTRESYYNEDEIVVDVNDDEGYFEDLASAQLRCDQLNESNVDYYNTTMATKKRAHDKHIAAAVQTNEEIDILRKAGVEKAYVAVPEPFEPTPFEDFISGCSVYTTRAVPRSEHDGIAHIIDTTSTDSRNNTTSTVKG